MLSRLSPRLDRVLFVVFPFFIVLVIASYIYIDNIQKRNTIYFSHNDKINKLIEHDTYFSDFINQNIKFVMFDDIAKRLNDFENILNFLMEDAQINNLDYGYMRNLKNIQNVFFNKKLQIERLKARKAFTYNTLSYLLDSSDLGYLSLNQNTKYKIDNIRMIFANLLLDLKDIENLSQELETLSLDVQNNDYVENFVKLTKAFISHYEQINTTMRRIGNIDINGQLNGIKSNLNDISLQEKRDSEYIVNGIF